MQTNAEGFMVLSDSDSSEEPSIMVLIPDEDPTAGIFAIAGRKGPSGWQLTFDELIALVAKEPSPQLLETFTAAIHKLVELCDGKGFEGAATYYLEKAVPVLKDSERAAVWQLWLGSRSEGTGAFAEAAQHYQAVVSLQPGDAEVRYYGHNNLGYCQNQLGEYEEAEVSCRAAIGVNPRPYNAHKNLGIAFEGQGKDLQAARSYLTAVRLCPTEPRALGHLMRLLDKSPRLLGLDPELRRISDASENEDPGVFLGRSPQEEKS